MTNDKTGMNNPANSTLEAVLSLLTKFFNNITSEQWEQIKSRRPDSLATEQLVRFVQAMLDLCQQSVEVLRSSQNSPIHEDSSFYTTTSKTELSCVKFFPDNSAEQEFDTAENIDTSTQETANREESCQNADQHTAAKAENNPNPDPQQQNSSVKHEASIPPLTNLSQMGSCERKEKERSPLACEPLQNNSDFKTWLDTLIQAVISQLAEISESHPSHCLQKHLLNRIWTEIQWMDLHLGPEVQKYLDSIANAIFTDLCEKLTVTREEDLMASMNLEGVSITISVFQNHLLAVTDIDQLESYKKKEKCRFLVEICVQELLLLLIKHSGLSIRKVRREAISSWLTMKIWAEIRAEYDKIPLERFNKLSKRVFKSLCNRWNCPELVEMLLEFNLSLVDKEIIGTFKRKLSKEPSRVYQFISKLFLQ
ncbi:unnamed protein product [Oreochromis niloticus]|nr:unnamed protein product [Mustela putorius furo]